MIKSILLSTIFHAGIIVLTAISLPHILRNPIDLPPIISVELIQISDITNIHYAPKAKKIIVTKILAGHILKIETCFSND